MSLPARTATRTAASRRPDPPPDTRPSELNTLRAATLQELLEAERRLIAGRRARIGKGQNEQNGPAIGLALSGGGVRSATFNLGVLQALAAHHALRAVDYLSTVSGGGYVGAFLGRFYTRFINRPDGAVDLIEARLNDPSSPEISWLRRCSEYMAVSVGIEAPATAAVMLRSFLTVHIVLGALLLALLNIANLFRYRAFVWLFDRFRFWLPSLSWLSTPINLVPSIDPWWFALELVVTIGLLPLMIAYWLPSASRPESYERSRLVAFVILSGTSFVMSLEARAPILALSIAAATMSVFAWTGAAWASVALKSPVATVFPAGRAMVRSQFNKWLAAATGVTAIVLIIWMLDDLFFTLYPERLPLRITLATITVTFVILFGPLRWLALWFFSGASSRSWKLRLWRALVDASYLLPVAACALLLVKWNLVSHELFRRGADVGGGIVWTVVAIVVSAILGGRSGVALANRSSLQLLYAARGSRTYLGASNSYRHATEDGADVTSPQPEDDVTFDRYRPDLAGGPLHLINVVAAQTIDRGSGRRTHNRPGENMAVGPCGLNVGPASHALWVTKESAESSTRLIDVGELPAPFVPRRDAQESRPGPVQTTSMQLSDWISISGAALSPSEYADTKLGSSLINGLTNVRAGFWWDSGIEDGDRLGEPIPSVRQRLGRRIKHCFRGQACLLAEFTGRYAGPFRRYWYLADGGLADGLGIYELVRRRVPIIICSDATRDVDGGLAALTNAMRRVRIDFGASIQFRSAEELLQLAGIPQEIIDALGTLDDVRFSPDQPSRKHAALACVTYPDTEEYSVLLYIKATLTGNEDEDVLDYHRQHPRFPNQSVLDQSLNEAQWESYRQLGQHCARPFFERGMQWLADVRPALKPARQSANGGE